MQENPYQTPTPQTDCDDDGELAILERIRESQIARRQWSRRCWLLGLGGILAGYVSLRLAQFFLVNHSFDWFATAVVRVATCVIVIGVGLIVFGPISWFWVRKWKGFGF